MPTFFEVLKRKREESPFTQKQMAEQIGVTLSMYQFYEKNALPPHDKLLKLNKALKHDFSRYIYQDEFGNIKEGRYDPLLKELQALVDKYSFNSGVDKVHDEDKTEGQGAHKLAMESGTKMPGKSPKGSSVKKQGKKSG